MSRRRFAVDIEGNGANPAEIVELAIAEMDDLALTGRRWHWRFRPAGGITSMATRVHGIRERDVADAPEIQDVVDDVLEIVDDAPIIGHNVRVDLTVLTGVLPGWTPVAAYDTLRLARRLAPDQPKYGLSALGAAFGLEDEAARLTHGAPHSAPYDAVLSALLLRRLVGSLSRDDLDAALLDADVAAPRQGGLL